MVLAICSRNHEADVLEVLRTHPDCLLGDDDFNEAGNALEPGSSAALLIYENTWAAPFATALRRSGAQLVANGRIPVNAIIAALDEMEQAEAETAKA